MSREKATISADRLVRYLCFHGLSCIEVKRRQLSIPLTVKTGRQSMSLSLLHFQERGQSGGRAVHCWSFGSDLRLAVGLRLAIRLHILLRENLVGRLICDAREFVNVLLVWALL